MTTPTLVWRKIEVKTYHPTKGDATITSEVQVRSDRKSDDPFFTELAKKLARGRGKVVEYRAYV